MRWCKQLKIGTTVFKLTLAGCCVQWQKAYKQLAHGIAEQYMGIDFAVLVECMQL